MRVFVTIESVYVVDVDATDPELAERAVENNWDTVYRHQATLTQTDGRFLDVRAEGPARPIIQNTT
jgi:hypothetical protein